MQDSGNDTGSVGKGLHVRDISRHGIGFSGAGLAVCEDGAVETAKDLYYVSIRILLSASDHEFTSSRIGTTTSSKIMAWSAAGEKTLSNWYVLLLSALGPMDSSTFFPLTPPVDTTTPEFSRTSRSLRPLHRTTTLMLVSSAPSCSKSRSLRLPPFCTDRAGDAPLDGAIDPRGDEATLLPKVGVAVPARAGGGRVDGGRILVFLLTGPLGRTGADMFQ